MVSNTPHMPRSDDQSRMFLRLYARHEQEIYAYILALVPNWADADEIMQDTCVRLWEQFERFEPGTSFVAWARTIARFLVLAFRKRTGRERVHFSQAFIESLAAEVESQRGVELAQQRKAALMACVDELPGRNRDLLLRVYGQGGSIKSIAEALGRPLQGTYQAISRIRKALYDCINRKLSQGG